MDDPKINNFLIRDPNKAIRKTADYISDGLQCVCGHRTFFIEKSTMYPFLHGKKWIERIHCVGCQKVYDIELTEKDKLKEKIKKKYA